MKLSAIVALAIAACAVTLYAAKGVPSTVTYIPHDKVSTTMAKGGQIIGENGLIVLAQRRGAGEVEVHENTNHVFIIVEGEATFVTGGTMVSPKNTAPGQTRAASVNGSRKSRRRRSRTTRSTSNRSCCAGRRAWRCWTG